MVNSDLLRGHLESIILKLILEQDRYGYELANTIKERTNERFIMKEATLYSIVTRLEKKGLIDSYVGEKTHGKKRRYYKITPLGTTYYLQKKKEWTELQELLNTLLED